MLVFRRVNIKLRSKLLLSDLNIRILTGEVSVLAGENGVGKSSLASAIAADTELSVEGEGGCFGVSWEGRSALKTARSGVFLAFQNPIEIPGVPYVHFLKLVVSRCAHAVDDAHAVRLKAKLSTVCRLLKLDASLLYRPVNVGFSGGERRLFEMIQMVLMEPKLCVLDEPDSGLDSGRLEALADLILGFSVCGRAVLVITHSLKLLQLLSPDSLYCLTRSGVLRYELGVVFESVKAAAGRCCSCLGC
ncbi:MAG: ATP-binding cassette domain-containing protein [Candidatus Hodgkinia cicadicola]